MEKPDTIKVGVNRQGTIQAEAVDIYTNVYGPLLLTGNAAPDRAKDAQLLIRGTAELGLTPEDLTLQGLQVDTSGGVLARDSSAVYQVKIHCSNLNILGDLLVVVTQQKNASIEELVWGYPSERRIRMEWLESCLAEGQEKAARISASLGQRILGVYEFSEKWTDSEPVRDETLERRNTTGLGPLRERTRGLDVSFNLANHKRIAVQVEIQFRVAAM